MTNSESKKVTLHDIMETPSVEEKTCERVYGLFISTRQHLFPSKKTKYSRKTKG